MKCALLKAYFLLAYRPSLFEIAGLDLDQELSITMNNTTVICKGVSNNLFY